MSLSKSLFDHSERLEDIEPPMAFMYGDEAECLELEVEALEAQRDELLERCEEVLGDSVYAFGSVLGRLATTVARIKEDINV